MTTVNQAVESILLYSKTPEGAVDAIVRQIQSLVDYHVAAERERCAQECELVSQNWSRNNDEYKAVAEMCAKQIRTGKH